MGRGKQTDQPPFWGAARIEGKAKELAQKWVSANFKLYQNKQICGMKMSEKITANEGTQGRGGEYNVQINFGPTLGSLLDLMVTFDAELNLKNAQRVNCVQKEMGPEPLQFPNEISEYRAQRLAVAQKKVDEINRSQKYWKAVIYEPFALLTDEELNSLNGVPSSEEKTGPQNLQLKTRGMDVNHLVQQGYKDLPEEFDARTKWPECADEKLKGWAMELNKMWKEMSKKMPNDMDKSGSQRHSLIHLPHPFFVSGGRFRELRYWDAYWIARGLIASGMTESVKNMCKNFAALVNRVGFVKRSIQCFDAEGCAISLSSDRDKAQLFYNQCIQHIPDLSRVCPLFINKQLMRMS